MPQVHQTFYAEFTADPSSWASPRPGFDADKFNRELERRAGMIGSVPRFRLRWAGDTDDYILEDCYKLTGYTYIVDGVEAFVPMTQTDFEFPDGCTVAPFFETHKIFTPRWVIEEYNGLLYEKSWFVELLEEIGGEYGRIDLRSHYREPSERDIQMAEQLNYLRHTLNDDDIRNGIARMNAMEARKKANDKEEMAEEIGEIVDKAFKDGVPSPVHFDIKRSFDPKKRIAEILKEGKI